MEKESDYKNTWALHMLVLILILFSSDLQGGWFNMEEVKNMFKDVMNRKLSDPDISVNDIKLLAEAYAELTKNDYMKDVYKTLGSGFVGFNGSGSNTNSDTFKIHPDDITYTGEQKKW